LEKEGRPENEKLSADCRPGFGFEEEKKEQLARKSDLLTGLD